MPGLQVEENWKQKLWNIVDERRPLWVELLREAIRRPTDNPPGTTTELASFYRVNLERQNIRVEVLEPKAGCPNIIASIVGSENGRHVGHKPLRGSKEEPNFAVIPKGMIKTPLWHVKKKIRRSYPSREAGLQELRDFALRAAPHLEGAGLKSLRSLPPVDNSSDNSHQTYYTRRCNYEEECDFAIGHGDACNFEYDAGCGGARCD